MTTARAGTIGARCFELGLKSLRVISTDNLNYGCENKLLTVPLGISLFYYKEVLLMKISAIMDITGLTKKAINYYEEEGLLSPHVNPENNYREYSQSDAGVLVQISVLRQFDVPLKDIKTMISNPQRLKDCLEQHLVRLDNEIKRLEKSKNVLRSSLSSFDSDEIGLLQLTQQLSVLNKTLELDERSREGFMKKQIERIFPGNFGKMLIMQYSSFLNEPIDTPEKEEAWISIVKFLDEVEVIKYPQEIVDMYEKLTIKDIEKYEKHINDYIEKRLTITDEGLVNEREKITDYIHRLEHDPDMQAEYIRLTNLSEGMRGLMNEIGYYDKFVKNLKILSKAFCAYNEKVEELSEFSKLSNITFDVQ
ncbi:MerR family transcriptional regulator [Paenibacillus sp. sgz500992]|uniref:MerR family transcriptional regulator n=1 Tax=Paenibacillus sp. sgz500992 TaxID=3242476 RepID=UPI0036D2602B